MDEHIEKVVAQMVKYPANFGHHCELPLYKPGGYGIYNDWFGDSYVTDMIRFERNVFFDMYS